MQASSNITSSKLICKTANSCSMTDKILADMLSAMCVVFSSVDVFSSFSQFSVLSSLAQFIFSVHFLSSLIRYITLKPLIYFNRSQKTVLEYVFYFCPHAIITEIFRFKGLKKQYKQKAHVSL